MNCEACNKEFEAKRADARFCSEACRKRKAREVHDAVLAKQAEAIIPDTPNSPDTIIADTEPDSVRDNKARASAMRAEADRLTQLQRDHRGYAPGQPVTIDGEKVQTLVMGTYTPTDESEARAAEIVRLRKQAACLEFPVPA